MELNSPIETQFRLSKYQKAALKKLGLETLKDLLYHFPSRYEDFAETKKIKDLAKGDKAVIYGKVKKLKTSKAFRKKIPMAEGVLEDDSGRIKIVWFHQPYIAKMLPEGSAVKVEGKVAERRGALYITNPEAEQVANIPASIDKSLFGSGVPPSSIPIYSERRGVTSRWLYHAVQKILKSGMLDEIKDPIPEEILRRYNLPTLKSALVWIHIPKRKSDSIAARKRFAFEEVFFIQLKKQKSRKEYEALPSWEIRPEKELIEEFVGGFPFKPTGAQEKAFKEIVKDISTPHAMSRLLEGDVGSGKTFVAAIAAYVTVGTKPNGQDFGNLQVAYMAPTEILANQLFEDFIKFFSPNGEKTELPVQIGLITGSGCRKFPSKVDPRSSTTISRGQLLKWVENGEIPILLGTHALIQKSVKFKNLALVIIDEQHRFGTLQRAKLTKKEGALPHLLSMTATPIPRTLALTIYGDLDLTLLDEMPPGRKKVITETVTPEERKETYEKIRKEIASGRQAYVICPRIEEPDESKAQALRAKSVKEEAARLKKEVFPQFKIEELHGKLKPKEKEEIMGRFASGKTDILVATSVVEVGMNVPNATVIVIEGAERFGLAQLHQLRGRVLRSEKQAYCYIFSDSTTKKTLERLKALQTTKNGFELAEYDLKFRGAGTLQGRQQWGISDVGMEAIKNIKMVEAARKEAKEIIEEDPELKKHPLLKARIEEKEEVHFE